MMSLKNEMISAKSLAWAAALILAYALAFWMFDGAMIAVPSLLVVLLFTSMIWLSLEDMRHQYFPLWGLAVYLAVCGAIGLRIAPDFAVNLITGAGAALVFESVNFAFKKLMGKTALGRGDAVMIAGAGVLLGPLVISHVILLAAISGIGFFVARSFARSEQSGSYIPFGPFLAFGTWIFFLEPGLFDYTL